MNEAVVGCDEIIDGYELSPQQRLAWRRRLAGRHQRVCGALLIEGRIEPSCVRVALQAVSMRHEILRTGYQMTPNVVLPLQVISDDGGLTLAPADAYGAAAQLSHASLHTLAPDRHLLRIELDALSADLPSMSQLLHEIAAACAGNDADINDEPMQYADVAQWLNQLANDEDGGGTRYWLGDGLVQTEAPTLYGCRLARRSVPGTATAATTSGSSLPTPCIATATLDPTQRNALTAATALGVSHDDLLFALWLALLVRHSGNAGVACWREYNGRAYDDLRTVLGPLAQYVPIGVECDGDTLFATLLSRVSAQCADARSHQEYFACGEVFRDGRGATAATLDSMPAFQYTRAVDASVAGNLRVSTSELRSDDDRFGLRLSVLDVDGRLELRIEEAAGLPPGTADTLLAQYVEALLDIGQHAAVPLRALVRPSQRDIALMDGMAARVSNLAAAATSVPGAHALIAHWARERGNVDAVDSPSGRLTYAALYARGAALAERLRAAGVMAEDRVALLLDRSPQLVEALVGTLMAGAAFVPIDPQFGAERKRRILADAQARVVLTTSAILDTLAGELDDHDCWLLDRDEPAISGTGSFTPSEVFPEQVAYLIYTSGSTGKPKGVAVSHGALTHYVQGVLDRLSLQDDARCSFFSTAAADLGYTMLFGALCSGRTLYLTPDEANLDGAYLATLLPAARVDAIKIVPSHFAGLLNLAGDASLVPRDALVFGGEQLDKELIARIRRLAPACRIFNHYGPTETTVGVLATAVGDDLVAQATRIPLGSAFGAGRVHVLDDALRPVPVGIAGELYVGGPGLARGYWGQPDMTAERFVPDPCSTEGERLYRSGDVVRMRPDGLIEFVGRSDDQIKLRGFRIELGEIESVLGQQAAVAACRVLVKHANEEDAALWAYVVPTDAAAFDVAAARAALGDSLPGYMVPSEFVVLDALPYTPNGKVDRARLLSLAPAAQTAECAVPPRTELERVLHAIWTTLLGRDDIGVEHDFFRAGGHSLLATQLVARIRDSLRVELGVRDLFVNPTIARLATRIAELVPSGSESPGGAATPALAAPARASLQRVPLSFAQQRLWFLDQISGASPAYNVTHAVRLRKRMDAGAVRAAFSIIVRRHEILRTRFNDEEGEPYQEVCDQADVDFEVTALPLAAMDPMYEDRTIADAVARYGAEAFDLSRLPLLRVRLLCLADDDHVLVTVCHHIVVDGWSTGVIAAEFVELYQACAAGRDPALAPLPLQYADYAIWQREQFARGSLQGHLDYWMQRLAGAPPVLQLPADFAGTDMPSIEAGFVPISLPQRLAADVGTFCERHRCTPYIFMLAVLNVLLARYSGQDDICIGSPVSNRPRAEFESLIGFFVNTVVMRNRVRESQRFVDFLAVVRDGSLDAYDHQDLPFEQLIEALNPERSLAHSPLFQVMFTLQTRGDMLALDGQAVQAIHSAAASAKFDLEFSMMVAPDRIEGMVMYRRNLFLPATVERISASLTMLLEAVVRSPESAIADLPVMGQDECLRILEAFNAPVTASGQDAMPQGAGLPAPAPFMLDAFRACAAASPDEVAVACAGASLTYRELDRRSDALAAALRARGVVTHDLVGIALSRSLPLPVAILATLKAGAAYVPIDPLYPRERIRYICEDARPRVLLNDVALEDMSVVTLDVRDFDWNAAFDPAAVPSVACDGDALAYVIYTSGTTGLPKGVMVTQRGLANYLAWAGAYYRLDTGIDVPVNSSVSFDATVTSLLLPLTAGRKVVLLPEEGELEALSAFLQENSDVSLVKLTPAHLNALRELGTSVAGVGVFVVGGEELGASTAAYWRAHAPQVRIVNEYGPTETVVGCSVHALCDDDAGAHRIPIGRPIANTQLYVLDAAMRPVPVGVSGELYIGGLGLARGYLGRADLTAERFVPDPFGTAGGRLYRTGDVSRHRADGALEYLGRSDHQVKLRGFRIELGEIEAALTRVAGVREAVAVVRGEEAARQLVAYVMGESLEVARIRAALECELPGYMVPSHLVVLDALPLTANGKVDRAALPAVELTRDVAAQIAPRDARERAIAAVWCEVLGLTSVCVTERFFDLGGHSLLAAKLVAKLRSASGLVLRVRDVFEAPTVEGQARRVERTQSQTVSYLVPMQQGEGVPLFLIHPVGGDVLCYLPLIQAARLACPVYALQREELVDGGEVCYRSIDAMAGRYLTEIRTVQPHGPYSIAGWSMGGVIATAIAARLEAEGEPVEYLGLIDSRLRSDAEVAAALAEEGDSAHEAFERFSAQVAGGDERERFDQSMRIAEFSSVLGADEMQRMRRINIAGLVASRRYRSPSHVSALHYYGAGSPGGDALMGKLAEATSVGGGSIKSQTFDGDHHSVMKAPRVQALAQVLAADLAAARRKRCAQPASAAICETLETTQ